MMNPAPRNKLTTPAGSRLKAQGSGQTTVETAILVGAAVTAMVAMSLYVQRAYQGYLYSSASTHGPQFEPNNPAHPYLEVQELTNSFRPPPSPSPTPSPGPRIGPAFRQIQEVTVSSEADLSGSPKGTASLPSVPGGQLPGRILKTEVDVTTDWNVNRRACYGDTAPCE